MAIKGRLTLNDGIEILVSDTDPVSSNLTLAKGSIVLYDGKLYQKTGDTAGDFSNFFNATTQVVAVSNSTLSLTTQSPDYFIFTGSTSGQVVNLGDATLYSVGKTFTFYNESSTSISIKDNSSTTILTIEATRHTKVILVTNTTSNGTWANDANQPISAAQQSAVDKTAYYFAVIL